MKYLVPLLLILSGQVLGYSCSQVSSSTCTSSGLVVTNSFNIYYFPPIWIDLFMPTWVATFTRDQMITTLRVEYTRPSVDSSWNLCDFNWIYTPYFKGQTAQFAPWIYLNGQHKGNYTANFLLLDINGQVQDCHKFHFNF